MSEDLDDGSAHKDVKLTYTEYLVARAEKDEKARDELSGKAEESEAP